MRDNKTPDWLPCLQDIDIRSVKPEDLIDIDSVMIRKDLSPEERVKDYIRQIRNPYCYLSHGVIVKISFSGTRNLEDCLETCLALEHGEGVANTGVY